jgi:hypothetical protein
MSASGQTRPSQAGQGVSALPLISDVDLLGYCKCVIHLDAKIANRALDLAVPEKQLHGSQIARAAVDQRRLGSAQRMGAENMRI